MPYTVCVYVWFNCLIYLCVYFCHPPAARDTWSQFFTSGASTGAASTTSSCRNSPRSERKWAAPALTEAEFYLGTCRSRPTPTACPTRLSLVSASCEHTAKKELQMKLCMRAGRRRRHVALFLGLCDSGSVRFGL